MILKILFHEILEVKFYSILQSIKISNPNISLSNAQLCMKNLTFEGNVGPYN